ncbi:MAG: hypothetical protein AAF721_28055 [Myxococcota bacterium]
MKALLLALALVAPNDPAARAAEFFERGEFEAAIEELDRAYEIEPDPAFIFARGSALGKLGRCDEAIQAYEEFLATSPPKSQAGTAFDRIQECRRQLAEERDEEAMAPAPEPEVEPEPAPDPDEPPKTRRASGWARDPLGGVLLGSGIALAATGGALVGVGAQRRERASASATEGDFRGDLRSSNVLQGVGIGLAVAGGGLIVGAVIRYAVVRRATPDALSGLAFRF